MDKKKYLNLKNKFNKGTLKNGFKYICSPNPLHNSCSIVIFVRVGSRNEGTKEYGLAHFLEHILFKGNRTYPNYQVLNKKIDSLHATNNASTYKNYTNYYFKLPSKNFLEGLMTLREMVFYSTLNLKEIEKEKKVVIEEINKSIDESLYYASDLMDKHLFSGHPLSHFILGSKKIISNLTRKQLMDFYKTFYIVNNSVISISGNVPRNYVSILEKVFGSEKPKKLKFSFDQLVVSSLTSQVIYKKRKQEQIAIVIGFPTFNMYHPNKYVLEVISSILYGNMSSRLWLKLRDNNPIVYGLEIDIDLFEEGGYFSIDLGLSKINLEKALHIIQEEFTKLKSKLVPEKELKLVKNKMISDLKEEDDDNLDIANYYGEKFLLDDKIITFSEIEKIYQKVTSGKIKKVSQDLFDFSKMTIVEVGDIPKSKLQKLVSKICIN